MPTAEAAAASAARTRGPRPAPGPVRYAVLCGTSDPSGPWAASALRARGLTGVRLVTVEELVYSTRFVHRQGAGGVTTEITLPDGAVVGPDLVAVLNRVTSVPSDHLAGSGSADRDYAAQEMYAVLTSVLASLPGVVNAAGPRGLPGPWLSDAEWRHEAGRAGLPSVGFRSGDEAMDDGEARRTLLVVGPRVLVAGLPGTDVDVPAFATAGCRALAGRVGARVLGVELVVVGSSWLLVRGNPTPDLRWGGPAAAEALVDLLAARGQP